MERTIEEAGLGDAGDDGREAPSHQTVYPSAGPVNRTPAEDASGPTAHTAEAPSGNAGPSAATADTAAGGPATDPPMTAEGSEPLTGTSARSPDPARPASGDATLPPPATIDLVDALREREAQYRALASLDPDGIVVMDDSSTILSVN